MAQIAHSSKWVSNDLCPNRKAFSLDLNVSNNMSDNRKSFGRLFHTGGPWTEKLSSFFCSEYSGKEKKLKIKISCLVNIIALQCYAWGTSCRPVSVCLSVCPSQSCIASKQLKHHETFSHPHSSVILVFWTQFQGEPLSRHVEARGWENLQILTEISVSWKRYKIGPWLFRNVNRKS